MRCVYSGASTFCEELLTLAEDTVEGGAASLVNLPSSLDITPWHQILEIANLRPGLVDIFLAHGADAEGGGTFCPLKGAIERGDVYTTQRLLDRLSVAGIEAALARLDLLQADNECHKMAVRRLQELESA